MAQFPHSLNLSLTIAGDEQAWSEVMIFLKDTEAKWEVTGIGRTFLEAIANLVEAIEQMTIVPPEVQSELLRGGIQLTVLAWGGGNPVQGQEDPFKDE